jgi:MFS family permease
MARSYSSNIPKLYIIKLAKWFMLTMPIIVLFYQENGLSMQNVLTLKAFYSVAIVIMEIPSGYFADIWGRKKTLILGSALGCLGFVVYSFSSDFYGFLLAELVLGIGFSFISGADSALLYDSLLQDKKEGTYLKQESRMMSVGNFAEALAGIAGGSLALISLRTPFIFQIFIAFMAIPASMMLMEVERSKDSSKGGFIHILKVVRYALWENMQLRLNILYSSIFGCATLSLAWFVQPYLKQFDMDVSRIGVIWTLLNLTVGFTALFAHRIESRLGKIGTSLLIVIGLSSGFILSGVMTTQLGIICLFYFYIIRGIATPILKDYINRITTSDMRATVLSLRNFIIRILFATIAPFLGWYSDHFSIGEALIFAGSTIFLLGGFTLFFIIKTDRKKAD